MINKDDFIKRLEKVLDYYDLSASALADKIGVQRSSISHLLSGRNNPSLDFVMRIFNTFPEVELYWLLIGKGNPPGVNNVNNTKTPSSPVSDLFIDAKENNSDKKVESNQKEIPIDNIIAHQKKNEIARIVIFYKNGTFEEYKNSN